MAGGPWDPRSTVSCRGRTLGIRELGWGGRRSWICGTGEGCGLRPIVGCAPQEDRDTGGGTGHSPGPPATQSSLPVVSGWSWQDASARVPGPDLPQGLLPPPPGSHTHVHMRVCKHTHTRMSMGMHTPTCQRHMHAHPHTKPHTPLTHQPPPHKSMPTKAHTQTHTRTHGPPPMDMHTHRHTRSC